MQDTWRITPKLTLNYGLRDDIVTPWIERHNQLAGFVPTGGGTLVPVGTAPYSGNTVTEARYTNFGPRAGFAYNLTPKTVIRGGFRNLLFVPDADVESLAGEERAFQRRPFRRPTIPPISPARRPSRMASRPAGPICFPVAGTAWVYYPCDFKTTRANEWNFNMQREMWHE